MRVLWVIAWALAAGLVWGQQPAPTEPDYRFLFVVDNSFSMRAKKEAVIKTVRDLVSTGFHNQAETGDRFGIWLYNEKITKGFPSQVWSDGEGELLGNIAVQYLEGQKFEGKTDLLPALLELNRYGSNDRDMLVFLFCEGDEGVVGTPFDTEINRIFTEYRLVLMRSKKPFLLTFAFHRGFMTAANVFYGAGVVELPQLVRRPPEPPKRELVDAVVAPEVPRQEEEPVVIERPGTAAATQPVVETPPVKKEEEAKVTAAEVEPRKAAIPDTVAPAKVEQNVAEAKPAVQEVAPVQEPVKAEEKKSTVPASGAREQQAIAAQRTVVEGHKAPPKDGTPNQGAPKERSPSQEGPKAGSANVTAPGGGAPTVGAQNNVTPNSPITSDAKTNGAVAIVNPMEPQVKIWPFLVASVGLLGLVFYWRWNKRHARPSSSLITRSLDK